MWFKIQEQQIELRILVKLNTKKTQFLEIYEDRLVVALHAKPLKGAANKALIDYLSKQFKIPKSKINLSKGEKSRHKKVILPINDNTLKFVGLK